MAVVVGEHSDHTEQSSTEKLMDGKHRLYALVCPVYTVHIFPPELICIT